MTPVFPLDYNAIRKAVANQVQAVAGVPCIMAEPESQNADRPALPYFTMKFMAPAIKVGDDASTQTAPGSSVWNVGGLRKLLVDFNVYGTSHEEAYNYATLWQAALETETTQAALRAAGIAVWLNAGQIRDLSKLLNTGYEGRCQYEVAFGVASNVYEDRSNIEEVNVTGVVQPDAGPPINIAVTEGPLP